MSAQTVPTSYEEAKKIGEAKYKTLQTANLPARMRYVVLNKGCKFESQLKYENAVYVLDKTYDLKGKTVEVPKNVVLLFRRGDVKNGALKGNDSKYTIVGDKEIACKLDGQWEKIAPIYTASELGLKPNQQSASEHNYRKIKEAVVRGVNVYLDGNYYVVFTKPIMLNYQLHLFGGKLLFSKYAFDVTDGGGIYANGVRFNSIRDGVVDDIVCGTRENHPAITTSPFTFLNCHFSCNRVISISFQNINPRTTPFGIPSVTVSHCYADRTGKFIILNSVIKDGCTFKNNSWFGFSSAPIYITCSHSTRTHPDESDANPWAEEIIEASGNVEIDSNIFYGAEVTSDSYYCSALVKYKQCIFRNNYLKDIINISDKKKNGYAAYDAYLSCTDVVYVHNYVEDMLSYSRDGAKKPQCEIGKSKTNPLAQFGVKARREYSDNVFVSDGNRFLREGADPSSLYTNIFNNVSDIDEYIWNNNSVFYRNIAIKGRTSSSVYKSFSLKDNYFVCESLSGNLIFQNSASDSEEVTITGNHFNIADGKTFTLFNQLYKEQYEKYKHGVIDICDNTFSNAVPVNYFFSADTVRIKRNEVSKGSLNGMKYMNNYSGKKLAAPVSVNKMDTEMVLDSSGESEGGVQQIFSSSSKGSYSLNMKRVPSKGVNYTYVVGDDHSFSIMLKYGKHEHIIDYSVKKGKVRYSYDGQSGTISFGSTKPIVWLSGSGISLKSEFQKGKPNCIVTSLSGKELADIVFEYKSF